MNKSKFWFLQRVNKNDKPLARLTMKKREEIEINRIVNDRGEITTDATEIQIIMRDLP